MIKIEELSIEEFLTNYFKNDCLLQNYFIFNEDLGYMQINEIMLEHTRITFYYNEHKDNIQFYYNDDIFYIYKIG